MGVDRTQPVAMERDAFLVRCSAAMCVGAKSVHQAGLAYSSTGLMNCLYNAAWASFWSVCVCVAELLCYGGGAGGGGGVGGGGRASRKLWKGREDREGRD